MFGEGITVVKRDGSKEPFIYEKVVVSLLKAGADVAAARRIALRVICQIPGSEVDAKTLTRLILNELKAANPQWYHNWIVFDRAVKRRETEKEL
ncbi:MAG: ATP cone domain-containing protein [Thermoproteus sp. AZ2]|jgi:transcriptional regulator NrdR family protein|uniref:ATP cone domain-containing protein n=1 Tax=Thermoproteus sp. AZ2 TaxID=1609232 RepID=A0ACC6UY21_9CREN|nr:MAG: ATPase [Thermoproteus sp. AZ2]